MKSSLTPGKRNLLTWPLFFLLLAFLLPADLLAQDQTGLWTQTPASAGLPPGARHILPQRYRLVTLDGNNLQQVLARAGQAKGIPLRSSTALITLPLAAGGFARFRFAEVPVMDPKLAARFPQIRTYNAQGADDPGLTAVFESGPAGFRGMIHSPEKGLSFIDPYSQGGRQHYMVYAKTDYQAGPGKILPEAGLLGENSPMALLVREQVAQKRAARLALSGPPAAERPSGKELRTYRLALAATGEYTDFHGGSVPLALAAIVTTINRVNFIFIRELSIRLVLVGNNDRIIYTDPATDPYSNGQPFQMIEQAQADLDTAIGNDHYDIGHVFGTNSGGVAHLASVCIPGLKAQGVTGSAAPTGDAFDVDYVAHEMGHQFGANHTFNGSDSGCGPYRYGFTAYEPGSGSTIMAYSGLCGPQNLQTNSDAYFHTVSYDEITAFTSFGTGQSCARITSTGNTAPVVSPVTASGLTIPRLTPFTITGRASDADGDSITYNWEQYDLGPEGAPDAPEGDAPIFRSLPPSPKGARTFPQLSDLLHNRTTVGEVLPDYARSLHFNLTVRDNYPGGGGVNWYYPLTVHVSGTAGPFLVTFPDTALALPGGIPQTITWQVAGTDQPPVNCRLVNIRLSTDGGLSFPILLAAKVPNTGAAQLTLPLISTNQARLKIEAADNIFFDVSNVDFTIEPAVAQVLSFTLLNANNQELQTIQPGELINLALLPSRRLNIRANTSPAGVDSVQFTMSGEGNHQQTENQAPYTLFGHQGGEDSDWYAQEGFYTLTATPFSKSQGAATKGQALSISFSMIYQPRELNSLEREGVLEDKPGIAPALQLFPNPSQGLIQVRLPGTQGEIRYTLLSSQGEKLAEGRQYLPLSASGLKLDLRRQMQNPGVYFLRLEGKRLQQMVRLMRP